MAKLPWQPDLTDMARQRLAQELTRSQYRLTLTQAAKALAEGRQLATWPVQLKGRTRWSASIKTFHQQLYHHTEPSQASSSMSPEQPTTATRVTVHRRQPHQGQQDTGRDDGIQTAGAAAAGYPSRPLPSIVYFTCPGCPRKLLPGTRPVFNTHNLDARLWCNSCRKSLFVKTWQCSCGIPWHNCPEHQSEPHRLCSMQQLMPPTTPHHQHITDTPAQPRNKVRNVLGQGRDAMIQQWLERPPPKRTRTEPDVVEPEDPASPSQVEMQRPKRVKTYPLGPKLRAKFQRIWAITTRA